MMSSKASLLAVASILGISGLVYSGDYIYGTPGVYGSYQCDTCALQTPGPDAGTNAYLQTMNNLLPTYVSTYRPMAGDQFIMCNINVCVTYTRTNSNDYLGGAAVPQESHGGGGAGGGGMACVVLEGGVYCQIV